jgi:hypothetical protein
VKVIEMRCKCATIWTMENPWIQIIIASKEI